MRWHLKTVIGGSNHIVGRGGRARKTIMSTTPAKKRPRTRGDVATSNPVSSPCAPAPGNVNAAMPPLAPPPFVVRIMNKPNLRTSFTKEEQSYMQRWSKKECRRLKHMLEEMAPVSEPRRLRVLRSLLPMNVKMDVFRQLAENETPKFEEWVETALRLPLGRYTTAPHPDKHAAFLHEARTTMDEEITGHLEAKQEVMRLICTWLNNGANAGFAIGLEGGPGIGKTSFAKRALSRSMRRPFCFIGLGGASDASGLLGHSYTYEGALPGRLTESLITSNTMDPIIFFDELDKISTSPKGEELVHALIHLTDPVQNSHIRDKYLHGINLDLSRAVLVFSYNDPNRVNPVLLDRIKRIKLNTPSHEERVRICNDHLIPRSLSNFPNMDIALSRDVIEYIVTKNRGETGMRGIERDIAHLISSFCLVKTYGSADVLGLSHDTDALDLEFASSVLFRADASTSHLTMYS